MSEYADSVERARGLSSTAATVQSKRRPSKNPILDGRRYITSVYGGRMIYIVGLSIGDIWTLRWAVSMPQDNNEILMRGSREHGCGGLNMTKSMKT